MQEVMRTVFKGQPTLSDEAWSYFAVDAMLEGWSEPRGGQAVKLLSTYLRKARSLRENDDNGNDDDDENDENDDPSNGRRRHKSGGRSSRLRPVTLESLTEHFAKNANTRAQAGDDERAAGGNTQGDMNSGDSDDDNGGDNSGNDDNNGADDDE